MEVSAASEPTDINSRPQPCPSGASPPTRERRRTPGKARPLVNHYRFAAEKGELDRGPQAGRAAANHQGLAVGGRVAPVDACSKLKKCRGMLVHVTRGVFEQKN